MANIIMETNILSRLSPLMGHMCRASRLPEKSMFSVLTSIASSTVAKSSLAEFYKKGEVTEREVVLTVIVSTFPTVLGASLIKVRAPIAIVFLGPVLGTIYVLLNMLSAFVQTAAALVYSRITGVPTSCPPGDPREKVAFDRQVVRRGARNSLPTLKRILPIVVVTLLLLEGLVRFGLLEVIAQIFNPALHLMGLPGEAIAPIMAHLSHSSAGYAAVASLLDSGLITGKQALITLLIGSAAVITMIYLRYSISIYVGLFGKFGAKVAGIAYLSSMAARGFTIMLVFLLL